ncbi:Gfo/Idh/MocA family oxidoreductase [Polynucleobacter sp. JS-Mosq-20-D10]|uniref:Gfo/Idh/MocA family protein n=1 Tax=Polynucleobacter sp. JS-Mosq-20-D10 TaxID=2576922 RepID=UPI001BFE84F8|nr:Gfo/Idh/MocA family oxidoreductase [Polynucleobacter sp. JS-Mosq-20-D10]QWE00791.1 Gfo/Idh/MocA family oxidoreductase [Polynucleobacter sp. JS-Mosq-20-D10]
MNSIVRVGLIGIGKMGKNHLRVLSMLKNVEIIFINDLDKEAVKKIAKQYDVLNVDNPQEYLNKIDALFIASPTSTHYEIIKNVAGKVRNIFVEKPLSSNLKEARDLVECVKPLNLNIQIGFIERYNPAVREIKKILSHSSGVVNIDFTRTNKLSSRINDVDVVTDLMIHDIDLALFINGPVDTVDAVGVAEGGIIDFASATLRHQNGSFSRIQASRMTEKKMRMIQATCKDMFIECNLLRKEVLISRQSELRKIDNESYTITAQEESIEVPHQEALLNQLQAFLASCYEEDFSQRPNIQAGLDAMIICDQIKESVL